jgi:hypothetical protein
MAAAPTTPSITWRKHLPRRGCVGQVGAVFSLGSTLGVESRPTLVMVLDLSGGSEAKT